MSACVYVPRDTTACAVGADEVAAAIATGARHHDLTLDVVRNGSRGAAWLEPLVEIDSGGVRLGFGPVMPGDVDTLLAAIADDPAALHAAAGEEVVGKASGT